MAGTVSLRMRRQRSHVPNVVEGGAANLHRWSVARMAARRRRFSRSLP
jgi:hypothetical protein